VRARVCECGFQALLDPLATVRARSRPGDRHSYMCVFHRRPDFPVGAHPRPTVAIPRKIQRAAAYNAIIRGDYTQTSQKVLLVTCQEIIPLSVVLFFNSVRTRLHNGNGDTRVFSGHVGETSSRNADSAHLSTRHTTNDGTDHVKEAAA
jgi:hypothetical protein